MAKPGYAARGHPGLLRQRQVNLRPRDGRTARFAGRPSGRAILAAGLEGAGSRRVRAKVAEAIEGDAWITDGVYVGRTFDLRLPRADTVIYLDQPRRICLWRILKRRWTQGDKRRADLAEGCDENISWDFAMWVWNFEKKSRPRIEQAIAAYGKPVITLKGDREAAEFLDRLGICST